MKTIYILILFLCIPALLSAQRTLEGKILDSESGLALPGANIFWAGTTRGTATNAAGYFVLKKTNKSDFLVISFVGYSVDTIKVDNNTDYLEYSLSPISEIDEIIVFGRASGIHIDRQDPLLTYKITGAELTRAACCNLSESFTSSASVDVSYSDALSGAKQIQLLGLSGSYVQIMTENFPALYGLGSTYGLNYIPGPWMESIQVSKGTSSVRNGYESISGQINIEFKKPTTSEKAYLNLYGNSSGKTEGNINTSLLLSEKLSTSILGHAESGQMLNDHNNDGFRDEPNVRQYHLFNRWDYLTETITLRAGVRLMEEERIGGETSFNPTESIDPLSDYGILINTTRAEAFTKTGFLFPADRSMSLGWINSFSYHDQEADFGLKSYMGMQKSYYTNLLYQWKPNLDEHTVDAGFSYRFDRYDEMLNSEELDRTEKVPGLFFQYSYIDTSMITLVAGIRADFHNLYGTIITPRVHLRYELTDRTTLRANAGKGFRSTNVLAENQFLLASNRNIDIADDLKMEEAWNFGGSLSSYYQLAGNELRLSVDFYHTRFINQVVVDLDRDVKSVFFYNLDGKSISNIAQIEMQWEPLSRLDLLAAFRWNDVRMTTDGQLQQRALQGKYKGLLTTSYLSYLRKWQYDVTVSLNGPGRIPSTEDNPPLYQRPEKFDPYMLINGQVTRKFKYLDIYLGIENLTNFKQEDPIISADNPFGDEFDTSLIWGPVMGRMIYGGIRISINR